MDPAAQAQADAAAAAQAAAAVAQAQADAAAAAQAQAIADAAAAAQLLQQQQAAAAQLAAAQQQVQQAAAALQLLQQQAAALQAAAAAAAQGPGGAPGPGGGQGGAVGAAQFALTPAQLNAGFLNFALQSDVKLYYKAVAPLTNKFDLQPAKMRGFIQAMLDKASDVNWTATLNIQVGNAHFDLIRQYGSVSLEDVRQHALTYVGQNTRNAQNSSQIYTCLTESLTTEAKNIGSVGGSQVCRQQFQRRIVVF